MHYLKFVHLKFYLTNKKYLRYVLWQFHWRVHNCKSGKIEDQLVRHLECVWLHSYKIEPAQKYYFDSEVCFTISINTNEYKLVRHCIETQICQFIDQLKSRFISIIEGYSR